MSVHFTNNTMRATHQCHECVAILILSATPLARLLGASGARKTHASIKRHPEMFVSCSEAGEIVVELLLRKRL